MPVAEPPPIVRDFVPFGARRVEQMRKYAIRHYGIDSSRLSHPKVIVEHYTASTSYSSAYNTFAANQPDVEFHETPGVCAHFLIDSDGSIHQLVRLRRMCRHTVGLNYTAIGIEHVGTSDAAVMGVTKVRRASLRLTRWLMGRFGIRLRNVIGHSESLSSPFHRELVPAMSRQTHGDMTHTTMVRYRRLLRG
ncbi:MAG: N-acetylmuramoyl-L-alanine amidase [Solirubrobacteraceae bacterium]